MLTAEIDFDLTALVQRKYREAGANGAKTADKVRVIRNFMESQFKSFNRRQGRLKRSAIPDGAPATIMDAVMRNSDDAKFRASTDHGWPWGAAYVFRGLRIDLFSVLDSDDSRDFKSPAYIIPLPVGQESERSYPDMICLLAYLHHTKQFWLAWIGKETDLDEGFSFVREEFAGPRSSARNSI